MSIDIGFTLKISQIFSLILLLRLVMDFFRNRVTFHLAYLVPFLIFLISILPSLGVEKIFSNLYLESNSIRLFFNYLLVQVIFLTTFIYTKNKEGLKSVISFSFLSYLIVLTFGIYQQIGFYFGFYDPIEYIGFHQSIVDFYGPFFRIATGTFANEFGEITQTIFIFSLTFFYFYYKKLTFLKKNLLLIFIVVLIGVLILNFTRISWLICLAYSLYIFLFFKLKIKNRFKIFSFLGVFLAFVFYIDSQTNFLDLLLVLDRLSELSDLSQNSAGLRIQTWEESYNLFISTKATILFGNGWGNAIETHNMPLEILTETGICGFLGYSYLMVYLSKTFYRLKKQAYLAQDVFFEFVSSSVFYSFVGCLIFDLTNHGLYHFVFWLIIAIGFITKKLLVIKKCPRNYG